MKKRIQKYLSGSNEGFSLVELIIVIAIMAILVGVVALAVIPNLERSRESKDLSTLDSVCSALAVAVANAGSSASNGTFKVDTVTSGATGAVEKGIFEQLGDCSDMELGSGKGSNKEIMCYYNTTSNTIAVFAGDGSETDIPTSPIQCQYAKGDDGELAYLLVKNAGGTN